MPIDLPALLLTRPEGASKRFAESLNLDSDVRVVYSPLLAIEIVASPTAFDAAIFTSSNGVIAAGKGSGQNAYCVGERTANSAAQSGYNVKAVCDDARGLISHLISIPPQKTLSHLRGEFARGDICVKLNEAGVRCSEQILYRQDRKALSDEARGLLQDEEIIILPLFSPRTALIFSNELTQLNLPDARLQNIQPIALSSEIAEEIPAVLRKKTIVPHRPSGDMMLQIVARYFNRKAL